MIPSSCHRAASAISTPSAVVRRSTVRNPAVRGAVTDHVHTTSKPEGNASLQGLSGAMSKVDDDDLAELKDISKAENFSTYSTASKLGGASTGVKSGASLLALGGTTRTPVPTNTSGLSNGMSSVDGVVVGGAKRVLQKPQTAQSHALLPSNSNGGSSNSNSVSSKNRDSNSVNSSRASQSIDKDGGGHASSAIKHSTAASTEIDGSMKVKSSLSVSRKWSSGIHNSNNLDSTKSKQEKQDGKDKEEAKTAVENCSMEVIKRMTEDNSWSVRYGWSLSFSSLFC